jgi:hypothetical protein
MPYFSLGISNFLENYWLGMVSSVPPLARLCPSVAIYTCSHHMFPLTWFRTLSCSCLIYLMSFTRLVSLMRWIAASLKSEQKPQNR